MSDVRVVVNATRIDCSGWSWRVRLKAAYAVLRGRAIRLEGGSAHELDCSCKDCQRFNEMRWS